MSIIDDDETFAMDGAAGTRVVARTEAFVAIEPATATNLSPGDIAYYDKMTWVMIVGNAEPDGRSVAIRLSGPAGWRSRR